METIQEITEQLLSGNAPLEVAVAAYCAANHISKPDLSAKIGRPYRNSVFAALREPLRNPGTIRAIKKEIGYPFGPALRTQHRRCRVET